MKVSRASALTLLAALALAGCGRQNQPKQAGPPDMASDTGMNSAAASDTNNAAAADAGNSSVMTNAGNTTTGY